MENNGKMIFTINTLEGVMECNDRNSSRWLEEINDILDEIEYATWFLQPRFTFMEYIENDNITFKDLFLELIEIEEGKKSLIIYRKEEREEMIRTFKGVYEKLKLNNAILSEQFKKYRNKLNIREYIDIWTCESVIYSTVLTDKDERDDYFNINTKTFIEKDPKYITKIMESMKNVPINDVDETSLTSNICFELSDEQFENGKLLFNKKE